MKNTTVKSTSNAKPRRFFAWSAILMAVIVVLSFPMTYFYPVVTGSKPFHLLHHVHGLAFFAWIGLYVLQTQLASRGKIARHREIGLLGFALTGAVILLGYWMAQRAAELRIASGFVNPYEFSYYNIVDISLFSIFMLASIVLVSKNKEWHRRLTYVAALCLVIPAATRWTLKLPYFDAITLDIAVYIIFYPFLIALMIYDFRTIKRLHLATLFCLAVLVPLQVSAAWIARTEWWNSLAPMLIGSP
tara:strand:+ start:2225 stop:2962 length:738 start_codon:yes stop_codon:yes gene_type:complete